MVSMIYKDRCEKHFQMFLLYHMLALYSFGCTPTERCLKQLCGYIQFFNYQLSGFEKVKLIKSRQNVLGNSVCAFVVAVSLCVFV